MIRYTNNLVVAALLASASLPHAQSAALKQQARHQQQSKWDDKLIAADMNDYKLYNLDRFESKKSGSFQDATHDKRALKEAEDMWEDDEGSSRKEEQASPDEQPSPKKIAGMESLQVSQQSAIGGKSEEQVQTEEEINDSKAAVSNSVGDKQIRIELQPNQDNLYMATFYLGTPGKPVRVILDTGSEHLAVASDLCDNCPTKPYSLQQSTSKQILSNDISSVVYGSAKFEGKQTQDKTCMQKDQGCMDFKFLSLSKGEGLDQGSDGILGLSPEMSTDRSDQHLVWSLMRAGLISRASFSLSLSDTSSFAVFGGIDEEQIVGGATGLKPFRNNPDIFSHIKAWALTGQALFYGLPQVGQTGSYPAVIDTGSTLIAVPSPLFKGLQAQWQKVVPDLDCSSDANFCETKKDRCADIEKKLQPVGFLIGGGKSSTGSQTIFEINPSEYLFQAEGKCQFAIAENKLDKFNNKNFIFGQLFLRHFYTVYNYENEQIALGINKNSDKLVRMVNPSQRESAPAYTDMPIEEPKVIQPTSDNAGNQKAPAPSQAETTEGKEAAPEGKEASQKEASQSEGSSTQDSKEATSNQGSPQEASNSQSDGQGQESANGGQASAPGDGKQAPEQEAHPASKQAKLQLDQLETEELRQKREQKEFEDRVSEVENAVID